MCCCAGTVNLLQQIAIAMVLCLCCCAGAVKLLQQVCRAAADSTNQTSSLAAQQREMVDKIGGEQEVSVFDARLVTVA